MQQIPDRFELLVVQQPRHARMCGFGEKDRRSIDPPPMVKIVPIMDHAGRTKTPPSHFVVHASLWSADGKSECNVIVSPPKSTRILMGSVVASPENLRDESGNWGYFACFPDLSIRTEGTYTLMFRLVRIQSLIFLERGASVIATALTVPFTVYSAKKFPGMTESTELSKLFRKQGVSIPIRNTIRPRKLRNVASSNASNEDVNDATAEEPTNDDDRAQSR